MPRILLIDDDEQLAAPLASYLLRFDMTLEHAATPDAGLQRLADASQPTPDALILDVMLPGMDGFELCRRIRRDPALAGLPLLMLSARGDVTDRVVGLELGADDYLPKPFEPRELAARLQTILRRRGEPGLQAAHSPASHATGGDAQSLRFDGLSIDLQRREAHRVPPGAEPLPLTSTEYELLVMLARAPGRVFSRDDILARLRGHDADIYTRAVDILVSRLRRKLEPMVLIKTLRNVGYTFTGVRNP